MDTAVVRIEGMSCQHCVARVERALAGLDGVMDVKVSLNPGEAKVEFGPPAGIEAIRKTISDTGYTPVS